MNAVQLHLIFNQLPVVGTFFALLLFAFAWGRSSDELKKVALGAFVIVAILAIPTYLTGEPAEDIAHMLPGVEESTIERHQDAAKIAFITILCVGTAALAALAFYRRKPLPRWVCISMLALALAATGTLAWTAHLGGLIRHPEIQEQAKMTND